MSVVNAYGYCDAIGLFWKMYARVHEALCVVDILKVKLFSE